MSRPRIGEDEVAVVVVVAIRVRRRRTVAEDMVVVDIEVTVDSRLGLK